MSTLLVPTDFSPCARGAVKYAIQLAGLTNSRLVFFHSAFAQIPTRNSKTAYETAIDTTIEQKTRALEKETDKIYATLGQQRHPEQTSVLVKFGLSVPENIQQAIEDVQPDIVVMGTQGASGLGKLIFGSTTADIITQAPVPVLAIPQRYRFRPIQKIICISDMSDNLTKEIESVMPWARELGVPVEVVYFDYGWGNQADRQQLFENAAEQANYPQLAWVTRKADVTLSLEDNLRLYLKRQRAFVLATFTSERTFFEKMLLGSLTKDLAYKLAFPLLSVRKAMLA